MKHVIAHQLQFDPGAGLAHVVQQIKLTALSGPTQRVLDWTIEIENIYKAASFIDAFGNRCHLVSQTKPSSPLLLKVNGTVETHEHHGVLGRLTAEPVPALYKRVTELTKPDADLLDQFASAKRDGRERIGFFHALMAAVGDAGGQAQSQDGQSQSQSLVESDATALTHAFIAMARAFGIPARFVTGYLAAGEHGAARFHAWAEAFDDGLGWIGFDCLLNLCPTDLHIRIASGLDADSTAMVRRYPSVDAVAEISLEMTQA